MKLGIILGNTGSPSSPDPDSVETYLTSFLSDPQICQLPRPLWKKLMASVMKKRKFTSSERYRFIWTPEGSPLVIEQRKTAEMMQEIVDGGTSADARAIAQYASQGVLVRSAMSYGSPSFEDVLTELRENGCTDVMLVPTYPQSAYCVTTAVVNRFKGAAKRIGWNVPYAVVDNYCENTLYIKAIARSIEQAGYNRAQGDRLVLSLHAIPLKDENAGDTYRTQIEKSAQLIARKLGITRDDIQVSFQSVFGPKKDAWVSPLTLDVLQGWHEKSFRVVVCCIGFAYDCLETLYDIPNEFVPALEGPQAKPVKTHIDGDIMHTINSNGRFIWVPSLGASDEQASMLVNVVRDAMDKRSSED